MTVAFTGREAAHRATLALPATAATQGARNHDVPTHDARRLTGTAGTATILLDGQPYVLRITRAGKLILTK